MGDVPITASAWLVSKGQKVVEGDRLLEVLAGDVTVDLPSPASGVLAKKLVLEDDPLTVGQLLGIVVSKVEPP